jgi:hypothetical protein
MQKKCKKMQDYLHMSKKSSTFEADLGIVPDRTIKYNRVMKKECIFKACKGNEWWYLYRYPNAKASRGCIYRIYNGRKWDDHISWFGYEMAMGELLRRCLGVDSVKFGGTEV